MKKKKITQVFERAKNKKNIIKLKIKFKLDKDSMKSITKLSTPKNNS